MLLQFDNFLIDIDRRELRAAEGVSAIKVSKEARGWTQPSDHVPVTATLEI